MYVFLYLVLTMLPEMKPDVAIGRLIRNAYNAESADETSRFQNQAASMLDSNKALIPRFCKRFLEEFQDEYELGTALSVFSRMESTHLTVAKAMVSILHNDRLSVHYKRAACSVMAKHGSSMKPAEVRGLFKGLSPTLAVSMSSSLLIHLNRFDVDDRLKILHIALKISKVKNPRERSIFFGTVIDCTEWNEDLYLKGIRKLKTPHHKAILMIALVEKDSKKYRHLITRIDRLASSDELARWFLREYKRMNDWCQGKSRKGDIQGKGT